jgi:Fe-S-cluster-containing dehydrogenase component
MSDCPADAIHKTANGKVSIDDTHRLRQLQENCPYGVIQMAKPACSASCVDRLLRRPVPEPVKTAVGDMCVGKSRVPRAWTPARPAPRSGSTPKTLYNWQPGA